MEEIYLLLKNHKAKHNLEYKLRLKDLDKDNDLSVHFTIYGNDWNNSITIYSFDSELTIMNKINRIRKLLNNKREALEFIGVRQWKI